MCQIQKPGLKKVGTVSGGLHSEFPFQDVSIDIFGSLIQDDEGELGKKYVVCIIDRCTRTCRLGSLAQITTNDVKELVERVWIKNLVNHSRC